MMAHLASSPPPELNYPHATLYPPPEVRLSVVLCLRRCPCTAKQSQGEANARSILGCSRIHTHASAGKLALWRQHLMRGGTHERASVRPGLRNRLSQPGQGTAAGEQRDAAGCAHFSFSLSLGPHSRHPLLRPPLPQHQKLVYLSLLQPHSGIAAGPGRTDVRPVLSSEHG